MTTQALLDRLPVRAIVFSGIAGGVNPSLDPVCLQGAAAAPIR